MKFILFTHEDTKEFGKNFINCMYKNWSDVEIEVFQTIHALKQRLKNIPDFFEDEVYIFMMDSKSRLLELIHVNHLMEDKHLILILPDESEKTIRLAMYLSPRFVTRINQEYEELDLVLKKMINKNGHKTEIR